MNTLILDADRCPRCHKRMHYEVGQDDLTGVGDMRAERQCWTCGYREADRAWSRPLRTAGNLRAEWLKRKRLEGWQVPIAPPTPQGEWVECRRCRYGEWAIPEDPTGAVARVAEHVRTRHGLDPAVELWPREVPGGD